MLGDVAHHEGATEVECAEDLVNVDILGSRAVHSDPTTCARVREL